MVLNEKKQLLDGFPDDAKKLRILLATEYLPPYVSGISNRCKNWIVGYRALGHHVTVASVKGTDCDIRVPSILNPWYKQQRIFVGTSLVLLYQLLNFLKPVPYDVVHVVSPLCLAFIPLLPLFWLRGVQIYISHHVFLEYYQNHYIHRSMRGIIGGGYVLLFWLPLVLWASVVGIPSKTADGYVFSHARQVHYLKSGVDTTLFSTERQDDLELLQPAVRTFLEQYPPMHKSQPRSPAGATVLDEKKIPKQKKLTPIMTYVGRLAAEKNVDFLIRSLDHPALRNATLLLVGDGPERPKLEALAHQIVGVEAVLNADTPASNSAMANNSHAPRPRVIFAGMILDEKTVAVHYALSDIFLSASESETFGFTITEAMACGTPPVMVRAGAFATVFAALDHCMFEPGNLNDFVAKIGTVLQDVDRQHVRRLCKREFSVEASVRDLVNVYRSICYAANAL